MEYDKISIIPSRTLSELRLDELIGREGFVVERHYHKDGSFSGAWVQLIGEPYQDEPEWFIPSNSIQ